MSVQFGSWDFEPPDVKRDFLTETATLLAPYAPDGFRKYEDRNIQIAFGAFHTTTESSSESQPCLLSSGAVLTWDGRLDNREELISELHPDVSLRSTDSDIVGTAIIRWGLSSLPKIVGDWALSLWDPTKQTLVLAKDFVGSRHLYYRAEKNRVSWSSILDPLALLGERPLTLCEEYIAGLLAFYPAPHLTPYNGVISVPPSCFVLIRPKSCTVTRFWNFDANAFIRYKTDAEYEEHFRSVFATSVRRRLRADRTILAELSGGMDSSSIVCVADYLIASGQLVAPAVETISYFSEREPNWNEQPYFGEVERIRRKVGLHICVDSYTSRESSLDSNERFPATPASMRKNCAATTQFAKYVSSLDSRVLLSGIGGDEFTGGVPTPVPELLDLAASGQLRGLYSRLVTWATTQRGPVAHLLWTTLQTFLPALFLRTPKHRRPAPWLTRRFTLNTRAALNGYPTSVNLFGPRPSFQQNLETLDVIRRQIASTALSAELPIEPRYPYLDRDLLTFLFEIPREQLVRPGERRSLMRRSLAGLVPPAILERKRKAFVSKTPFFNVMAISRDLNSVETDMALVVLDILNKERFTEALGDIPLGKDSHVVGLLKTLNVEAWLRQLQKLRMIRTGSAHHEPTTREVTATVT
jgi:asparagine synthase (glutamine-hydrolysing)